MLRAASSPTRKGVGPVHAWRLLPYCRTGELGCIQAIRSGQIATPLLVFCIAPTHCQAQKTNSKPSIESTHFPPATKGRRARVDSISGRVSGQVEWMRSQTQALRQNRPLSCQKFRGVIPDSRPGRNPGMVWPQYPRTARLAPGEK